MDSCNQEESFREAKRILLSWAYCGKLSAINYKEELSKIFEVLLVRTDVVNDPKTTLWKNLGFKLEPVKSVTSGFTTDSWAAIAARLPVRGACALAKASRQLACEKCGLVPIRFNQSESGVDPNCRGTAFH